MTSKLTKEWLQHQISAIEAVGITDSNTLDAFKMALAAMDSEPVAWTWHYREQWHVTNDERRAEFVAKDGDVAVLPLYRHAQSAQISEPVLPLQDKDLQGVIDALEHPAGINAAGKQVVRHALVEIQERRKADREPVAEVVSIYGDPEAFGEREIRPLVGIQQMPYGTKLYRHAQPMLVMPEEMTIRDACKFVQDMRLFDDVSVIVMRTWNACRAAMLAASPQSPGSEPATVPGKWIPLSEKMPPRRHEVLVGCWWGEKPRWCCKWATYIPGHPDAQSSGWLIPGASWTPTHWMPLPVAP